MLLGHYGAGFALKKFAPKVSLGFIFLAVQLVDIIWAVLVIIGVEKVRIAPGFTAVVPMEILYQPFSHSLVSSIVLTAVVYLALRLTARQDACRARAAIVLALAVFSHFLLDLPVHTPDMPLLGWDSYRLGFGLWNHPVAYHVLEYTIYIAGLLIYLRSVRGRTGSRKYAAVIFGLALFALGVATSFTPTPKSSTEMAFSLLMIFLITGGIAFIVDGPRAKRCEQKNGNLSQSKSETKKSGGCE